jgi:hypothetical protein
VNRSERRRQASNQDKAVARIAGTVISPEEIIMALECMSGSPVRARAPDFMLDCLREKMPGDLDRALAIRMRVQAMLAFAKPEREDQQAYMHAAAGCTLKMQGIAGVFDEREFLDAVAEARRILGGPSRDPDGAKE